MNEIDEMMDKKLERLERQVESLQIQIIQKNLQIAQANKDKKELHEALRMCSSICAGETTSKSGLIKALEAARSALAKQNTMKA